MSSGHENAYLNIFQYEIFKVKSHMAKYFSILTAVLGLITVDNTVVGLGSLTLL